MNLETLVTELRDTVRFRQSVNPDIPQLDPSLVDPSSARLLNNPLLTNQNLQAIYPNFEQVAAPTLINGFSDWLSDQRDEAIRQVFSQIYNAKKVSGQAKELLNEMYLYTGYGVDTEPPKSRKVGFQVELLHNENIKLFLRRIGFQVTGGPQDIDIEIWSSEIKTSPIATTTLNIAVGDGSVEWFDLSEELTYVSDALVGGKFYILYDETQLAGPVIKKKYYSRSSCASCRRDLQDYKKYSQYVSFIPVSMLNTPPNPDQVSYQYDNNFGINFSFNVKCDVTDIITKNKETFADVIVKQLETNLVREISGATRNNVIDEKIMDKANFMLQNTELGGDGLIKQLDDAKESASWELQDLSKNVCWPVERKGSRFTSVKSQSRRNNSRWRYSGY